MSGVVRRRSYRKLWLAGMVMFVAVSLFTFLTQNARNENDDVSAANLANFDAGYIISDYQMGNYNSMTEAEIQNFLNSKINCNRGESYYNYLVATYPGYSWHFDNGHIVCLNEEKFGDGETIGSGDTAAHIIWQAAQDYRINPQVLIVLLQKEQGLITDNYPNTRQYRSATGYGCPDTAPCASEYYGFKNQVRKAAAMFRTVLDGGWTNYPLGENWVRYSDKCTSGSMVDIRNLATSALYRYTPYQPNAAALAAGYGSVAGSPYETCAAYGNRNFYLYFEDWFGGVTDDYNVKIGRTIPDGTYQINSKLYVDKSLDVYAGVRAGMESGRLILYSRKDETMERDNQTFEVKFNARTGYYNIYNEISSLYLYADATELSLKPADGACGQNWNISRDGQYYSLISACAGKVIAAKSDSEVVVDNDVTTNSDKWRFFEISGKTNTLSDGVYQISTVINSRYVIDIKGGVKKTSTSGEIELWEKKSPRKDITNQTFEVKYDMETGYYSIVNPVSGMSLDVYAGGTDDGTKVIAWAKNSGCNQQWMIREEDDGYEIISMCSGKTLDVPAGNVQNGQELIIYTVGGAKNQLWKFEPVEEIAPLDGEYTIATRLDQNKVIDISGGVSKNSKSGEAILFTAKANDNANQIFSLKKVVDENYYYIYNPESNLYLDVNEGGTVDGTKVILWPYNGACNQKWDVEEADDGYYKITSSCTDKSLDLYAGSLNDKTPMIIYSGHGGLNQQWSLIRRE